MTKYLIFACFWSAVTCQAQVKNFAVHASAYFPLIPSVEKTDHLTSIPIAAATGYSYSTIKAGVRESFSDKKGIEIRGQFDYPIAPKFFLTSGLSLSYIQFRRVTEVTGLNGSIEILTNAPAPITVGQPFGSIYASSLRDANGTILIHPDLFNQQSEKLGNTTALSLKIPMLIGTSFLNNKFQVRTGAVFSYLLRSTEVKQQYSNWTFTEYEDSSKESFNEFQAGVALQTTYLIHPRVGIEVGAEKFFSPIYQDSEQVAGRAKYNFLSLGASYNF